MGIELGAARLLALAATAGVAGMDQNAWPQAMVARPLVAATAGGWLLGDPAAGFLVGAFLELLTLRRLPFGGARCPDLGPASVVGGAAHAGAADAVTGGGGMAALLGAALVAWGLGWLGEITVQMLRRLSAWTLRDGEELARRPEMLERRQRLLAAADFLRGAALGAAFAVPGLIAVRLVAGGGGWPAGVLAAAALGAAAGAGARSVGTGGRGQLLVVAGAAAGLALGAWLT